MNVILLDCLMYEDDVLFARALSALNTQFGQRETLLEVTPPATTHSDNTFRQHIPMQIRINTAYT